jgi:Flp pilus assembly protein TadG
MQRCPDCKAARPGAGETSHAGQDSKPPGLSHRENAAADARRLPSIHHVAGPNGAALSGGRSSSLPYGWQKVNLRPIEPQRRATLVQRLFARNRAPIGTKWSSSVMLTILKGRLTGVRKRLAVATGFARREDGAAAVEFAIVAAPFIALLLATVQTALAFFAGQVLESAVADASRQLLTGSAQNANLDQAGFNSLVCGKVQALFNCSGLMVDVQTASSFGAANTGAPTLTYDANGKVTNNWSYQPGAPGDIVVMRVMYQWPVFTGPLGLSLATQGNGNMLLMATATFKNEPYTGP